MRPLISSAVVLSLALFTSSGTSAGGPDLAKALAAGREAGLRISDEEAITWITRNAAWALGLDDRIGTIEPGKNADVVLWSGNPLSVYTRAEKVWIDGAVYFDRADASQRWRTDFELGYVPANDGRIR